MDMFRPKCNKLAAKISSHKEKENYKEIFLCNEIIIMEIMCLCVTETKSPLTSLFS